MANPWYDGDRLCNNERPIPPTSLLWLQDSSSAWTHGRPRVFHLSDLTWFCAEAVSGNQTTAVGTQKKSGTNIIGWQVSNIALPSRPFIYPFLKIPVHTPRDTRGSFSGYCQLPAAHDNAHQQRQSTWGEVRTLRISSIRRGMDRDNRPVQHSGGQIQIPPVGPPGKSRSTFNLDGDW